MSNALVQLSSYEMSLLFEQLSPQDVADFYTAYQQWLRQRRMTYLQTQIIQVRQQIAENNRQLQLVHPSPIALASLARLQSNGVTDLDLLDRMLERGETWLDNTMQHLEYCEKFDFIRGNYTEWCEHALEGAYDWIDSMRKVSIDAAKSSPQFTNQSPSPSLSQASTGIETDETLEETTEEIFLQKLMSEMELEDTIPTLQAIPLSAGQDQPASIDPTPALLDETPAQPSAPEATNTTAPIPLDETSAIAMENTAATTLILDQEALNITPEETVDSTQVPIDETSTPLAEHISAAPANPASEDTTEAATHPSLPAQEVSNIPTLPEIPTMPALQSQEETIEPTRPSAPPPKKRNFFQRLFSIFSRS